MIIITYYKVGLTNGTCADYRWITYHVGVACNTLVTTKCIAAVSTLPDHIRTPERFRGDRIISKSVDFIPESLISLIIVCRYVTMYS